MINPNRLNFLPQSIVIFHVSQIGSLQIVHVELDTSDVFNSCNVLETEDESINPISRIEPNNIGAVSVLHISLNLTQP
jgi:hypothetical protein